MPVALIAFNCDTEGILNPIGLIGFFCIAQGISNHRCERSDIGFIQLEYVGVLWINFNRLMQMFQSHATHLVVWLPQLHDLWEN